MLDIAYAKNIYWIYILNNQIEMAKDTSISIRIDSELKVRAEYIIEQFGLNMTVVVNMLFRQIVRDKAIPISMSLDSSRVLNDLAQAKADRAAGYKGRPVDDFLAEMEQKIIEAEKEYGKKKV